MRRARLIRATSTRDVCIFCATRQLAAADVAFTSSSRSSQRRHLNSPSRPLQYATEAQVYVEERRQPPRPLSMAEKMRQQLSAMPQYTPQSQQPTARRISPVDRPRAKPQMQQSGRLQPQVQRRSAPQSHRILGDAGRHQSEQRHVPKYKYNINMESRPPMAETPQFNATGHLRRRNEPRIASALVKPKESVETSKPQQIRKLDQAELSRLLEDNSNLPRETSRPYARLSRQTSTQIKCFNCGQEGHRSFECPDKPSIRQTSAARKCFNCGQDGHTSFDCPDKTTSRSARSAQGSLKDAAEAWVRKESSTATDSATSERTDHGGERRGRESDAINRRMSRFAIDEPSTTLSRNRYDEPQRRQRGGNERRARGRIMFQADEEDEGFVNKAERKRQRKEAKKAAQLAKNEPTPVYLPEYISVANLASMLKLRVEDFVRKLEELGFEEVQNDHILNAEHAGLIAQEYNFEPVFEAEGEDGDLYPTPALSPEEYTNLPPRPPVVTIMGHVDHGKTTILDYMRNSSIAAGEFGGITQHIGAFSVPLASGKKITFLDTPGHAAFETMRARGANVTDIVVLVVAADDSVMPQTVEAIKHAQAAKVPIIVAVNKIDKQQADPDRVKLDLGRHGIDVEDFGGEVQTVLVSGKTGQGIPDLEEAISTQSEILDHRADPEAKVEGWILEATTKKSGKVATILVRSGTLRQGQLLVAGTTWTRVRSLRNEAGSAVQEVGPGIAVEVDGWREQPVAGDEVLQAEDEQHASAVSELRIEKVEREQMAKDMEAINEYRRLEADRREAEEATAKAAANGDTVVADEVEQPSGPELISFIVKADVSGSVEAVIDSISAVGNNEVGARILRHGVGSPSEFDVKHAADAKGHIVNFNTVVPANIAAMAEDKGVRILDSNIIYRVVENVKALMSEKLRPLITQRVTGEAEIAAVFEIGLGGKKKLRVAGSKVRNGIVEKGSKAKVLRRNKVVFEGAISSLKNQKKDVEQMRKDTECGIAFDGWEDFQVGDKVQCFEEKSEKRTL